MYDHVGLRVRDESGGFGPKGRPALWLHEGTPGAVHLAFRAENRKAVDRFHAAGREAGGRDNGRPGLRPGYSPNYYAAFLLDPDGNNVEAVHLD